MLISDQIMLISLLVDIYIGSMKSKDVAPQILLTLFRG